MTKPAMSVVVSAALIVCLARAAQAQPTDAPPAPPAEPAPPAPPAPPPLPPATDPLAEPPLAPSTPPPAEPPLEPTQPASEPQARPRPAPVEEQPEEMSEGRRIVVAWNTGFQWGLSPGVVFSNDKASFFLGLRLGYGFDTGKVIVVPGVRLSGYFTDPNVYLGMPVIKLVYPIDRFAPFIEGGAGVGYVEGFTGTVRNTRVVTDPAAGLALLVGGGFLLHFTAKFGLGVEATYQTITGTGFRGFGIGPLLALAF